MDATLMVITLVSLATTGAVLFYLTRLVRDERERSDARVAALAQEIRAEPLVTPDESREERRQNALRAIRNLGRTMERASALEARPGGGVGERRPPARGASSFVPADASGPEDRDVAGHVPVHDPSEDRLPAGQLFAQEPESGASRRTWIAGAVGAAVVALVLMLVYVVNGPGERPQAAAAAAAQPLELLSLGHTRSGGSITISGAVRNPAGAAGRHEVAAVVFLSDRNGTFLSSGRAPIDYRRLGPGEESPFVVVVPRGEGVARYRVSFRSGDDIVPHVDRRAD